MKYYKYKMNLGVMNFLAIILFIPLFFLIGLLNLSGSINFDFIVLYFFWMFLHEFLHGVGFLVGGASFKSIFYGICLEKGIMYCLCKEKVSKNCIMTSLVFPFLFIGVLTFFIGLFFNSTLLILLSLFNIVGCIGDLCMFFYFLMLPDFSYIDMGECDGFVLISSNDLSVFKDFCFNIINVDSYSKLSVSCIGKRFDVSKFSFFVILILFVINFLLHILI